ncbi:MAG: class I SAM-dependent methyltransferase [Solirubrobacteraceae bacterium]
MKLHLGCGDKILPGFVNVDARDLPGVDVPNCDVADLHMFDSGSADLVYACHVLEHVPRPSTFPVLLEWNRVLRSGGVLRLAVPDWDATVEVYRRTRDYENLLNWIYGGREYAENVHYRQFTFHGLSTLLNEAGFKRVSRYDWTQTEHADTDDFSKAYVPHMDHENGVLLSLNVECVKHYYPPEFR